VLALHLQGISSQEISNLAGVTTRRVNQIIAAERKQDQARQMDAVSGK
jgi:DNA-directed RNA polymerase specialized sigma24 family protein